MKNLKTSMNASHTNSLKSLERKHTNATRRLAKGMDQKIKDTDSMLRININESSRISLTGLIVLSRNVMFIFTLMDPVGSIL